MNPNAVGTGLAQAKARERLALARAVPTANSKDQSPIKAARIGTLAALGLLALGPRQGG
jgi:hypothetical protein